MTASSEYNVKLTVDVSDYIAGMKQAVKATRRLSKAYRALPRRARMIARLSSTRSISDQRLTDTNTTRRMAGPKIH